MIHVLAMIEVAPGNREEFLDHFRKLIPMVRAEQGCLEYGPAVDLQTSIPGQAPVGKNVVTVIEKWESVEALENHLMAPHMLEYRETVKDIVTGTTLRVLQSAE